jgi:hypothetical protein
LILIAGVVQAATLMDDDFSDGDLAGWEVAVGVWNASTQKLVHASNEFPGVDPNLYWGAGNASLESYTIEFDVYPDQWGDYDFDLFFHVEEIAGGTDGYPRRGYRFFAKRASHSSSGNDFTLYRISDGGTGVNLAGGPYPDIAPSWPVTVVVTEWVDSTVVEMDVNGASFRYSDTDPGRPGYGGIGLRSFHERLEQSFDNFVITGTPRVPSMADPVCLISLMLLLGVFGFCLSRRA